jgi:pimeloyl-ACP methyl ester carboxylesterase
METREIIFTVEGQPLHAVRAGKPNRQIALLIHGWSSSSFALSPLLGLLSQRFSCIAVDLPGYGKSPPFPFRATIPAYVEVLADLLEEISDGPVVLVGHSMGGMISLTMALRYPALVERMVLLSPTISGRLSNTINFFISPITLMERFGLGSLIVSTVERLFVGLTDRFMRPVSFAERTGITSRTTTACAPMPAAPDRAACAPNVSSPCAKTTCAASWLKLKSPRWSSGAQRTTPSPCATQV